MANVELASGREDLGPVVGCLERPQGHEFKVADAPVRPRAVLDQAHLDQHVDLGLGQGQERLPRRQGRRADQLLDNPRFRAGYDFLLLRESAGEQTDGLGEWWTDYQDANDSERRDMIRDLSGKGDDASGAPRKRRRSGGSKRKRSADASSTTGE